MNLAEAKEYAKKNIHNRPQTTGRLAGKIAVVTGGAQGFGLGIATEMYREGASVVLADLNDAQAKEAAKGLGERAIGLKVDVSDAASMEEMVCAAVEHFGGIDIFVSNAGVLKAGSLEFGGIDIFVSNAGVLKAGSLEDLSTDAFTFVTKVNYIGYFNAAKYASAIMKAQHEADENRPDPELRPGAGGLEHQGEFHLPGQFLRRAPLVRSGAGTFCAVPERGQGAGSEDRGGCEGLLSGQISDSQRLYAQGRVESSVLRGGAGV